MTDLQDPAVVITHEWHQVLDLPSDAGREEDFFALGGNSMLAVMFAERIERRLGIEFPMEVLFVEATLDAVIGACRQQAVRE